MKKNFAAILASIMIASSLTITSCDSTVDSKETTKDGSVATVDETLEEATETTKVTESETTGATLEDSSSEESLPEESKEPVYTPVDESIKTYFDNLIIPETTQSANKFLRLKDESITEYVPGTNKGAIFPYHATSGLGINIEWGDLINFDLYGFVDSTGTIVCDPKYDSVTSDVYDEAYIAFYKDGNQNYFSIIDKFGTYIVDIPYDDYMLGVNSVFVFDKNSCTVKVYDLKGNLLCETAKIRNDIVESIMCNDEEMEESFFFWNGLTVQSTENYMIDLMTGNVIDLPCDDWDYFWSWAGPDNTLEIIYSPLHSAIKEGEEFIDSKKLIYSSVAGVIYDDDQRIGDTFTREIFEASKDYYAIVETDAENYTKLVKIIDGAGEVIKEQEIVFSPGCMSDVWFTEKGMLYKDYDNAHVVFTSYFDEEGAYSDKTEIVYGVLLESNDKYFMTADFDYKQHYVYDYDLNLVSISEGYQVYCKDDEDFYIADSSLGEIHRGSNDVTTSVDLSNYWAIIACDGYYMIKSYDEDYEPINILYNPEGEIVFWYKALNCDFENDIAEYYWE